MPEGARRPRVPAELAARIDVARGDVPFERWVRRALEQALGDSPPGRVMEVGPESGGADSRRVAPSPAPARASEPPTPREAEAMRNIAEAPVKDPPLAGRFGPKVMSAAQLARQQRLNERGKS